MPLAWLHRSTALYLPAARAQAARRLTSAPPAAPAPVPASAVPLASTQKRAITVANGDGIGPEIMAATVKLLDAAGLPFSYEFVEIGEKVYNRGIMSGVEDEAWASLDRTKIFLKSPITTPLGKGVKSLNVTMRKTLGMYANVRPVFSYHPFVKSLHPKIDLVVVRENEEDCYAGIEHRHTSEVFQCIKLVSIPGTEKICRYAFEYARNNARKKVTCVTKSNIMKLTDGMFQEVFMEIAKEYPDIKAEHQIVDIATARVASKPENYDVICTLNLYGDIISDVAAEVAGSVGMAGSSNVGTNAAMFEAVHGSAPDLAGKDIANPSGLMNASVMMLNYMGYSEQASTIHNAMLAALEDGYHTADIAGPQTKKKCGTMAFTKEIIARLGAKPRVLTAVDYASGATKGRKKVEAPNFVIPERPVRPTPNRDFVGVDVFVDWDVPGRDPNALAKLLNDACIGLPLRLTMISNRGVKVWPDGNPDTYKVDHWRCRFVQTSVAYAPTSTSDTIKRVVPLLERVMEAGLEVIKTENLYLFDGQPGYSRGQGQ